MHNYFAKNMVYLKGDFAAVKKGDALGFYFNQICSYFLNNNFAFVCVWLNGRVGPRSQYMHFRVSIQLEWNRFENYFFSPTDSYPLINNTTRHTHRTIHVKKKVSNIMCRILRYAYIKCIKGAEHFWAQKCGWIELISYRKHFDLCSNLNICTIE